MMLDPTAAVSSVAGLQPSATSNVSGGDAGFGEMLSNAIDSVAAKEAHADSMVARLAAGDDVQLHEVAIATTEAALAVELMVAVRDQAIQAYQQIANLQL